MRLVAALLATLLVGACSPEAGRARGGGPGADPRNYGDEIRLREGPGTYHGTPSLREES